jgi:fused signal recognition particle receptor
MFIFKKKSDPSKEISQEQQGILGYLKNKLKRTRATLLSGISDLFLGKKAIDANLLEELETHLLLADIGVDATKQIIGDLTKQVQRKELNDSESLFKALKMQLVNLLQPCVKPLVITNNIKPFVILMIGVNGSGKTTTIGKLAKKLQQEGKKVILAAGDTFRAAAIEQLQVWGERNNIPVIAQQHGADSAAVVFDAMQAAQARGFDVLIADTAGRLHTQENLMEELKKVKRILSKLDAAAPHEVMLILDAGIGQNALVQARQFKEAVDVSGITLTKLDGTAKGGIIFAMAKSLAIPIRFIGVGESIDDLRQFSAEEFVEALFND